MQEKRTFSIKSEGVLKSVEDQVALARRLQKVYENRPNPNDFVGAMAGTKFESKYTKEAIDQDNQYVLDTKAAIEKSNKDKGLEMFYILENGFSLSEMMQAMIIDRINDGMFPSFKAIMTSERDDLRIGMDAIFKSRDTQIGASWDFTSSGSVEEIQNKLEKIWKYDIEKGAIPVVKYYEDPDTHKKGSLMVPKFVIGCSKKEIEFFAKKYLEGSEKELNNHPLKYLIIKQMDEQLQPVLKYFNESSLGSEFDFIKNIYKKIDIVLKNLKEEINYNEFVNTKEFFDMKKNSVAYNAIRDFFQKKV